MIRQFTGIASRYYSYRWLGVLASVLVFLTFAAIFYGYPRGVMVATLFVGPALAIAWGMALICFWFEPLRGSLYGGAIIRRIPRAGRVSLRGVAVVFLVLWFVFGVLVWPALILLI
jgi:hypothetical protein